MGRLPGDPSQKEHRRQAGTDTVCGSGETHLSQRKDTDQWIFSGSLHPYLTHHLFPFQSWVFGPEGTF